MENDVAQLVSNVGFPIAVAVYVLVRLEKGMAELKEAITTLTATIKEK